MFSVSTVSLSKAVPFQTIQFSISTWFKCQNRYISSNIVSHKYAILFFFTHRLDPIYQMLPIRARVYLGAMAKRGTQHSPKLQYFFNSTIRLLSAIFRTFVEGGLTPLQRCSQCILQPQLTEQTEG